MRNGDFSELLANRGSNLNSIAQLRIPRGFPNAGQPAPNNDMRPYMTPLGRYLASLYPLPNYNDPNNLYNYVYSRARADEPHRLQGRASTGTSATRTKAYVRIAREGETTENPRGVWWGPSDVALPSPNIGKNSGRSYRRQRRLGAQPDDDERGAGQLQPPDARQPLQGSERIRQGAGGMTFNGIFPAGSTSPYLPTDLLHGWGTERPGRQPLGRGATTCTRTTTRCSSATS